jgi:hypothetical protein
MDVGMLVEEQVGKVFNVMDQATDIQCVAYKQYTDVLKEKYSPASEKLFLREVSRAKCRLVAKISIDCCNKIRRLSNLYPKIDLTYHLSFFKDISNAAILNAEQDEVDHLDELFVDDF